MASHGITIDLKACFADPQLDVMNFLNEVVMAFPDAISFAPGRPREAFFEVERQVAALHAYVRRTAAQQESTCREVWQALGQYGATNGSCTEVIARHLATDERIVVDPRAVMMTVGAQEAIAVLLTGLFEPGRDVLLASNPTYIGITGLARLLGIRVVPVDSGPQGLEPTQVARAIDRVPKPARVRALYDIPDFNNPLGTSMPVAQRQALLELCRRREVLIFEDNAYGMFAYDHDRLPTLKSLDTAGTVIYIGSFSKTLFPALRLGYLVADQRVAGRDAWLAQELSRVKSLITVNTPSLTQALVAELLQASGYSLASLVHHRVTSCKAQRDAMLAALAAHFDDLRSDVTWNVPSGGFFLTLTVPFAFGPDEVRACAANFGVVVCPMTFFCLDASRRHQVRLAFSYIDPEHIWLGVQRLAAFVRTRSH